MPPRYAYWTIIVDNQPTAFRSGSQEELMPTFKRLKAKNDSAVMMWWQNGKLWPTRVDAQEAMIGRGEMGRRGDVRQSGTGFRSRDRDFKASSPQGAKTPRERSAWTPRGEPSTPPPARNADDKLDWKPKGEFVPAPKRSERPDRPTRSEWKPKSASFDREERPRAFKRPDFKSRGEDSRSAKPEWKPKGSFDRDEKSEWKPKASRPQGFAASKPEWKSKGSFDREERPRSFKRPDFKPSGDDSRAAKPEWKPKGSFDRERKPDWKPKGSFDRDKKSDWKPKERSGGFAGSRSAKPEWKSKGSFDRERPRARSSDDRQPSEKLDWKPKGEFTPAPKRAESEKRKWVPKEEYKKSMGIEAKRDSKWRPGGEHKDPRQKYKDAKKAKWTKFKKNIRTKSEGKRKKDE